MPYSAVTQPRPLPAIQRGTLSCAEAVQITRVSPTEISAEPVAVRMNPGSIVVGRSSSGLAPVAALTHLRHRLDLAELDVLDRAQRHLQEARAQLAERLHVAGAQEPVVALALARGFRSARVLSACSTWRASAAPEVTSVTCGPSIRWSIGLISG